MFYLKMIRLLAAIVVLLILPHLFVMRFFRSTATFAVECSVSGRLSGATLDIEVIEMPVNKGFSYSYKLGRKESEVFEYPDAIPGFKLGNYVEGANAGDEISLSFISSGRTQADSSVICK